METAKVNTEPPSGTVSYDLLQIVRARPGATTKELVEATGRRHGPGTMAFINTMLNHLRRRGFIENRAKPKTMGRWWLL